MGVGRNGRQKRMYGVDKMDTEGTLRRKNWKFGRRRGDKTRKEQRIQDQKGCSKSRETTDVDHSETTERPLMVK